VVDHVPVLGLVTARTRPHGPPRRSATGTVGWGDLDETSNQYVRPRSLTECRRPYLAFTAIRAMRTERASWLVVDANLCDCKVYIKSGAGHESCPGDCASMPGMSMRRSSSVQPAPRTVRLAAVLLFAVVGVQVLRVVLTFVMFDSLLDAYVEKVGETALPREVVEDGAPQYKAIALINAFVIGGLLALSAAYLLRGAKWARITATVIAALGVCGGVLTLFQPLTPLFTILGVGVAIGLAAAVVLLWRESSGEFFRPPRW
jgi:hypothetical protein